MNTKKKNFQVLFIGAIIGFFVFGPHTFSSAVEPGMLIQEYPVPQGFHPHDVAPAPDGTVWYTAQRSGELGRLDPKTGKVRHVKLGDRSSPHGVIVGAVAAVGAAAAVIMPLSSQLDSRSTLSPSAWTRGRKSEHSRF